MKATSGLLEGPNTAGQSDIWSEWLLHRRHADDEQYGGVVQTTVESYAKRVLDGAHLLPGMILLDIGSGEGLVPFEAIKRVGPSLRVVVTDISAPMLEFARGEAERRGVLDQCTFLECSADSLDGIADSSIDVVTTRASLAYVSNKKAAFREIFRVLKPGGRLSIVEPVFAEEAFGAQRLREQVELEGSHPENLLLRLFHRCKAAQFPDTEAGRLKAPHVNYSERDIFEMVTASGFSETHLEFHIDSAPSSVTSWEVLLGGSPHPWAPTLGEILNEQFTADERDFFEHSVRRIVESGSSTVTEQNLYLTARKPAA